MRLFSRRPPVPPAAPVSDVAEAEIAVGSLAGIAPADIERHILIVLDKSGRVAVSGTSCQEMTTLILAELLAQYARQAHAAHARGSGR